MTTPNQFGLWFQELTRWLMPYFIQFWGWFQDYAFLRSAFIAAVAYLIAKLVERYFSNLVDVAFKKLQWDQSLGDAVANILNFLLFNLIFLLGLLFAIKSSTLSPVASDALSKVILSILVIVVAVFFLRLFKLLLTVTAENDAIFPVVKPQTLPLFDNMVLIFVIVGSVHQVFSVWHVDMTALLASAGIAGIAIGMASRDVLSDIISGMIILTDGPYKIGDVIDLSEGERGRVTHVGIRSTRIVTKDNIRIIIPNSQIGTSQVSNETSINGKGLRLKLPFQIAYGVDSNQVRESVLNIAEQNSGVRKEPKPVVILSDFDQRHTHYTLLFWITDPEKRSSTSSSLREAIYNHFLYIETAMALPNTVVIAEPVLAKQEIKITEMPVTKQEIAITEMPESTRTIRVTEIPNLFGNGKARPITANRPASEPTNKQESDNADE